MGKDVRLNGKPATIIGVMPQGFSFPGNEEMWIPALQRVPGQGQERSPGQQPRGPRPHQKDVPLAQAQAEFAGFAKRFAAAYPDTNKQFNDAQIQPLIKTFTPLPIRGMLLTMLAFGVGVLLIACVNVMNMQFARATIRLKELAIRSSLGATRIRLIRQMLTESLLVATLGAVLGIGLAYFSVDWLSAAFRSQQNGPPPLDGLRDRPARPARHGGLDRGGGAGVRPDARADVVAHRLRFDPQGLRARQQLATASAC